MELVAAQATAPGSSGAAAAAAPGSASLTIRNSRSAARILDLRGTFQASGWLQWTSPSLHDQIRGYRANVIAAEPDPRLALGSSLNPQPQETQSVTIAGSAVAGDVETVTALVLYGDLAGSAARMATWDQVRKRTEKLTTISATISGTAAGFTGGELINAESDLLKANRDYAVLGMTTNTLCPAIWLNGTDTANVNIGVPGDAGDNEGMANYFVTLSRAFGLPLIPVLNSGNKGSTLWGIVQDENNITPLVTMYLALLD